MRKIFVANWKSNKTSSQIREWVKETKEILEKSENEIIVCPTFVGLEVLAWELRDSFLKVGAQNVSQFPSGAYTGEVSAQILTGLTSHCIVGHSERKKYFGEDEEAVSEKVKQLLEVGITPILCVRELEQLNKYVNNYSHIKSEAGKIIFVYEPPGAISGGGDYHPESPDEASQIVSEFKNKLGEVRVLYGGSVNPEIIKSFLGKENITGFLVGKASLNSTDFVTLIKSAS